ncbi:Octanoyl-[GcvH]:protein N-octanoyltransferase [Lentibacillus sp. JNUCC-1]|uniref:lipoate--protein ligase family protein n=1 Tax=Lentibacillus sp. JNUCC-1 TaxID=2654513 RepID=UPI00132AFBF2|nr:lipoate--protein ligase family protein [Lentibacillus sp. JNUCC-1]MUV37437.1 Octanoyl-[GcvH]:protein N-octanoyltransferase [Lentibacillus sp. JNUCC-1]
MLIEKGAAVLYPFLRAPERYSVAVMTQWNKLFKEEQLYRVINHIDSNTIYQKPNSAIASFAADDALATAIAKGSSPATIRFWVHDKTVVLGIPDGRLPLLPDGIRHLNDNGFQVMIRNSGGLAVALDKGVLNISLILSDARHLSINAGYEAMVHFIKKMFADVTDAIEAYEIVGSYCPGDFDLSIDGRKFAGISQRRIRDAAAVQIYLDVFGDSQQRAEMIRDFYKKTRGSEATKFTYPDVEPEVMGSLNDLLGLNLTISDVAHRARTVLAQSGLTETSNHDEALERQTFEKRYTQMQERNQDILQMQNI